MIIQENILRVVNFSKLPSHPLPSGFGGMMSDDLGWENEKLNQKATFHPQKFIFNYKLCPLNSANKSLKIFNFWGKHYF